MKTDWELIKTTYITGNKSLAELAENFRTGERQLKRHSSVENWPEQRKLFRAKTENLAAEQRSTQLAGESAQFDSDCLQAARKGVQIINTELDKLSDDKKPESATAEELLDWMTTRKASISSMGKALGDYQKAGRLAFGEKTEDNVSPAININVVSEKGKEHVADLINGKGSE